jgi:hypothetical protein
MKKTDNGTNLVLNDQIVEMLSQAIYRGAASLKYVPELVRDLIVEERWQKRVIRRTGEEQLFSDFESFVKAEPLEGLGSDIGTLRNLCVNDPEVVRMIDRLVSDSSQPVGVNPYVVSFLTENYPELAEKVISSELTSREAAAQAGFQERRTRLFPGDIEDTATKIVRIFESEWGRDSQGALQELIKLLSRHLK